MAGGWQWDVAAVITVVGWLLSPIITLLLPKIFSCFGFDASKKLRELEIHIIPELESTLRAVDQERMMQRGKKSKSDVAGLDKMAAMLRHAREDAEDIFDDAQHKIFSGDIIYGQCLGIARIIQKSLLCRFLGRPDVETLKADLDMISLELGTLLLKKYDVFRQLSHQLSRLDKVRMMIPKTLRANMLKTLVQLRWLRPKDTAEELYVLHNMYSKLMGQTQEEYNHDARADIVKTVERLRMLRRGKKSKSNVAVLDKMDVAALDKMATMLRHALEDAEDIFDDAQDKIVSRCWHRLYRAFATCIARFKTSCAWIARTTQTKSARLLQWVRKIISLCRFLRRSEDVLPVRTSAAPSDKPTPVTTSAAASNGPVPVATNAVPSDFSGRWLSCWCNLFDFFKNCCRFIFYWLAHAIDFARFYRDWSYDVVGITSYQENATALDFVLTAILRRKLKKRIGKVESTISEVKKSPLLDVASNNAPNDIANKNRRRLGAASKREVFGREVLRDDIMARLRETPQGDAPSSSPCYSVIGIYGIAGSGKTTFAGYIRDYIKEECEEEKLFDTIMCIHVSETFSVEDIFQEMLKDIGEDGHSNISDRGGLNKKLEEALRGKRFLLILDDLWVKNRNDQQLEELISPFNVGLKGSKILVTARTKDAAGTLCADKLIEMPDLDEDQYLMMFMHYALGSKRVVDEEFVPVGRVIAEKLHSSPIAAVTVAGRLGTKDISFWKNTANHETFNETMDALWWSYQQLNPDIRRCFEFCNIFPPRSKLKRDGLVRLWIAQGFVKTSCATEDMEDVAVGYVQELVSCSFLQPAGTSRNGTDCFRIHDLLQDLLAKVVGTDCFTIENERSHRGEGWKGEAPRDVRHLFVQNYDGELITKKILGLENLRTLIIYAVAGDTAVEEKVIESICMRLPKLRVLAIAFNQKCRWGKPNDKFLVPESIIQLKHLRYLAIEISYNCMVIFPSTLAKLHHINLQHIFCSFVDFPNIGSLSSLQTIPCFIVRNEQGYEIKQLKDLNQLRGSLMICGLENVKSKEETLEANLTAKERLMKLTLCFSGYNRWCTAEVEAKVLEGLCPPIGLETLYISSYNGLRYPDWMVGKQNGGPKDLQKLTFWSCGQLGPGPELEAFPHLRVLEVASCSWDSLPGNMEHLTSLETLEIRECMNIRSLPTLPQSLKKFEIRFCHDELMKGCQTEGHPYWHKIKHISEKKFFPLITN